MIGAATPAGIRLERALCPRCGVAPDRVVRSAPSWLDDVEGQYTVRACPSCSLWITDPRPAADELWKVYPAGYHRIRVPDRQAPPGTPARGRLLDVGCGVGDGMATARAQGWECVGIEISPEAAAVARGRGFDVVEGDVLTVDWPDGPFQHVRCWHVLEHVVDPLRLLGRLRESVADDGTIEIVVPERRSATNALFRRRWYHLDVPRHLHHFRRRDVEALAREAGLELSAHRTTAHTGGLAGSIDVLVRGTGRPDPRLRSRDRLRSRLRMVTYPLARAGLGDVSEYRLRPRRG